MPCAMQELEFLQSVDDSDDELPMPMAHRSFVQNICDAFVIAIQRCGPAFVWFLVSFVSSLVLFIADVVPDCNQTLSMRAVYCLTAALASSHVAAESHLRVRTARVGAAHAHILDPKDTSGALAQRAGFMFAGLGDSC